MADLAIGQFDWRLWAVLGVLDTAALVFVLGNAAVGFWTGFLWQFIRLLSIAASTVVAFLYSSVVADSVSRRFSPVQRQVMATVIVLAAAVLACYLVAYLFRGLIRASKPAFSERVLGALVGLVKGVLLVALCSLLLSTYAEEGSRAQRLIKETALVEGAGTALDYALPATLHRALEPPQEEGAEEKP